MLLAVYNGNLYVTGSFPTAGEVTVNGITQWNGSVWDSVSSGFETIILGRALTVYNGNLIVGGQFSQAGRVPATDAA